MGRIESERRIKKMRRTNKMTLSIFVVFVLVATAFFVNPVSGYDQAKEKVSSIPMPPGITLYDIAWNENNYRYAIAVGVNTSATTGVVYRFVPPANWVQIFSQPNEEYYDVVYDTYKKADTFYFVGSGSAVSKAYKIENAASPSPTITTLGTPSGDILKGACFIPTYGNSGALIAVGHDIGTSNGLIALYDIYNDTTW